MKKIENGKNGFDVPTSFVSSIGEVVWPPRETNNERLKGIYPFPIMDLNQLNLLLGDFSILPDGNSSRISARALINDAVLRDLSNNKLINQEYLGFIESIIPLAGAGDGFDNFCLVYLGRNKPERQLPREIKEEHFRRAFAIFNGDKQVIGKTDRNLPENFELLIIDENLRSDPDIQRMYFNLYSTFGWNEDEVKALLLNPANLIVAGLDKNTGIIVSSGLVEFGKIQLDGLPALSIAEITEAATLKAYRGFGLYGKISDQLLKQLAVLDDVPHLVFGESNLDSEAVLKVAARQGRISAINTAIDYSLPDAWFLNQHVRIYQEQRPENYPYNNLMVTFLTRQKLIEKYGRGN